MTASVYNCRELAALTMSGWGVESPTGKIYLRPDRGSGGWSFWLTRQRAQSACDSFQLRRGGGVWRVVKLRADIVREDA